GGSEVDRGRGGRRRRRRRRDGRGSGRGTRRGGVQAAGAAVDGDLVGQDRVAAHDGDAAADDAELLLGRRVAVVHHLERRVAAPLDVAVEELLRALAAAGELPGDRDEAALRARVHDAAQRRVARAAEVPAALERLGELLRHDLRVERRVLRLGDLDLRVVEAEPLVQVRRELLDRLAAAADHEAGALRHEVDARAHGRARDLRAAEARALRLAVEELADRDALLVLLDEFAFDRQIHSSVFSSLFFSTISMWLVLLSQAVARPWARGIVPGMGAPRWAAACHTYIVSGSSPLYSALLAASLRMRSMARAVATGNLPGPTPPLRCLMFVLCTRKGPSCFLATTFSRNGRAFLTALPLIA